MSDYSFRALSSLAQLVLLLAVAGCGNGSENPFVAEEPEGPEEPLPPDCLPLDEDIDRMANVLPIHEGQEWDFNLFINFGSNPAVLDSLILLRHVWRTGTITLRFLEIQPCQDSTQTISIEKKSTYWEISKWNDGTVVIKRDSTFIDTTETFQWLASRDEIRMNANPYSLPIPRLVGSQADTLVFDVPCYRCAERLVLTLESGILEYYLYSFSTLDDDGISEHWTRR